MARGTNTRSKPASREAKKDEKALKQKLNDQLGEEPHSNHVNKAEKKKLKVDKQHELKNKETENDQVLMRRSTSTGTKVTAVTENQACKTKKGKTTIKARFQDGDQEMEMEVDAY